MKNQESPEVVQLTPKELNDLLFRLEHNHLTPEDKNIIKGVFRFSIWLQQKYDAGKLTIHNLKRLLFGPGSERRSKKSKEDEAKEDTPSNELEGSRPGEEEVKSDPSSTASCASKVIPFRDNGKDHSRKGHGRLGADAYPDGLVCT